jgi:hypothetical protein
VSGHVTFDPRDRRIQLVTGEILDLAKPNLGRPDGTHLWDRLSVGEGEADRRVSTHDSPSARCLFPLCEGTGTGLVLVNLQRGLRYARHFKDEGFRGENGTSTHSIAHADQSPIVNWLCDRYTHANYQVETEHRFTTDGAGWEQKRVSDYFIVPDGKAAQPIAGEVQNARTNHRQRAADARKAGFASVWTFTRHGESALGVAQLRFTTTFEEASAERDPSGVRMAGFADLDVRNIGGCWTLHADLRRLRMGQVAEELPGGGWVEFRETSNKVLLVPPEQAARFAEYEYRGVDESRPGPAAGIVRRHRHLLARQKAERTAPSPAPEPAVLFGGQMVLDWSDRRHSSTRAEPCVMGDGLTFLRSDSGRPWHKTCAEAWLAANPGAAL